MGAALCGQRSGARHLDDFAALAVRARREDAPQRLATVCADPEQPATPQLSEPLGRFRAAVRGFRPPPILAKRKRVCVGL
jgi:hypothetical protein